jgi:hypothetical protein
VWVSFADDEQAVGALGRVVAASALVLRRLVCPLSLVCLVYPVLTSRDDDS